MQKEITISISIYLYKTNYYHSASLLIMNKQALKIVYSRLAVVTRQMLHDASEILSLRAFANEL